METEDPTPRRTRSRRSALAERVHARVVIRRHAPELLALWGLAVAQPLLDLFGKNPEFFVVNGLSSVEVVLFALLVLLVGPAALVVAQLLAYAVRSWLGDGVHMVSVALLAAALAMTVLGQLGIEDSAIVVLVAVFLGVLVAYLEHTVPRVGSGLRYLALTGIVFFVAFVGFSPTVDLVWGQEAEAVTAGDVGRQVPIVLLSMDEFPVASLLRSDGTIDAQRFPNFARLAESTSWFRNATSVAPLTQQSVPATFTGRFPENDLLPTAEDHPRSIFTLLGDGYDQFVEEQITDVCPDDICPEGTGSFDLERLRTSLADAAAVYAQATLPPSLREHFPAVDRSWGGFIADANQSASTPAVSPLAEEHPVSDPTTATADGADNDCPASELWCGAARFDELIGHIQAPAGRPDLYAGHLTVPHAPWIRSAEGLQYAPRALVIPGTRLDGSWSDTDPALVRQSFQRHLLQVAYVDTLLGQLIDELEAAGIWDQAMVVVTADHGVAFAPGLPLRAPTPTTVHEIYNVPLFIKVPGQVSGEVREDNALTIDVLPTIVDALDIDTDWTFDGESLVGDGDHRPDKPVVYAGVRSVVPVDFAGVLAVAARNETYVAGGGSASGILAVGAYADLVGRAVTEVDLTSSAGLAWSADEASTLADWDPEGGALAPLLLHGHLAPGLGSPPTEGLVTVNGTVVGVAVAFVDEEGGGLGFTALIDESALRAGANDVGLLLPTAPGGRTFTLSPLAA